MTTTKGFSELPASTSTTFIGRRAEVTQIKQLLAKSRAVVITGAAGIGKTRVGLQVAHGVRRAFDRVELLTFTSDRSGEESIEATLTALVENGIPTNRTLLLLDGCDAAPEACTRLLSKLALQAPHISVLATSRWRLDTAAATTWALPPMSLPTTSGPTLSVRDALRTDSVTLFVERACTVYPDFEVTEKNVGAIGELCVKLDGLPLALELAAARMRALTPAQLLDRLDTRYRLLVAPSDPAASSLWSTMEQAYATCSQTERSMWDQVAVFAGPFSVDDFEVVCSDATSPDGSSTAVAESVTGLVDKSVISYSTQPGGGVEYRMFETLRTFGREKLREQGRLVAVRTRHLEWIRALARRTEPFWMGPEATEQSDLLLRRHADIVAALDFALNVTHQPATVLALCSDLRVHWMSSNRADEGSIWLQTALDRYDSNDELRATGLWVAGYLSALRSKSAEAGAFVTAGSRLSDELGSRILTAHFTYVRGLVCWSNDQPESAALLLDTAYHRYREQGEATHQRETLFILGMVLASSQSPNAAADLVEKNLSDMSSGPDWWGGGYAMWLRGYSALEHGDVERARALLRECVITMQPHNDRSILWWCLELLGWAAAEKSAYRLAAQLLGAAETYGPGLLPPVLSDKHSRYRATIRRALGPASADRIHLRGMQLSLRDAVELAATDGETASTGTMVESGIERLSDREIQVALLVARGLSNKEIAASLVVSNRTAEGHVQRILAKRGFGSRSQIAAWIAETAIDPDPHTEKE